MVGLHTPPSSRTSEAQIRDPILRSSKLARTGNDQLAQEILLRRMGPRLRGDDAECVAMPSPYILNSACRSIFPVPVFGSSSVKITSRGYL